MADYGTKVEDGIRLTYRLIEQREERLTRPLIQGRINKVVEWLRHQAFPLQIVR